MKVLESCGNSPQLESAFSNILKCEDQVSQASPEALTLPKNGCEEKASKALLQRYGWTLGEAKAEGECVFLSIWACIVDVMGAMLPPELTGPSFSIDEAARMLRWFAASFGATLSMNMEDRYLTATDSQSGKYDLEDNSSEWIRTLKMAIGSYDNNDKWAVPYVHADGIAILPIMCVLLNLDINMFDIRRESDGSVSLKVNQFKFARAEWEEHVKKGFCFNGRMDVEDHLLNNILPWEQSLYEGSLDRDPVGTYTKFVELDVNESNATSTLFPLWTSGKDNIGISIHRYAVRHKVYHFVPVTSHWNNAGTLQFKASYSQRQSLGNKLMSIWRMWEESATKPPPTGCPWDVPTKERWLKEKQKRSSQKSPKKRTY